MMIYYIVGIIVLIVIGLGLYGIGVKSQRPLRRAINQFPTVPYEEVQWQSHGEQIKGWFIPAEVDAEVEVETEVEAEVETEVEADAEAQSKPAPLVIIAHGWGSNRVSMLRYIEVLHKEGYALLTYDARSHGDSAVIAAPSGISMRDDLIAALNYGSARPEVDANRIAVLGHSLGAYASALALAYTDNRIRAMVTDAMPARTQTMMESELRRKGIPRFPLVHMIPWIWYIRSHAKPRDTNATAAISSSKVPLLMIHSERDDVVPITEMDYIQAVAHRPAMNYVRLDCEGHSSSPTVPLFWQRVLPFLRKHLSMKKLTD